MKDSKKIRLHIESIIKKMDRCAINFDHPLQRASEQWTAVTKGNLISDILQENPIPDLVFAEQIIHDAPVTWGIDGKQRCTNIKDFVSNGYSISKNIDRFMIDYAVPVLDDDGVQLRDDDGIVVHKTEVCDIRGKKFKNLPKELQERILDYGFDIVLYYDCSEENLAYHIKRYNEGRAMNAEQKGITRIGTHFASVVRNISSMAFFEDGIGNYKEGQFKNGKINRIIVESVMTTRFLDEWSKDFGDNCDYIKNSASNDDFEAFRGLVESLEDMVDPTVGKMFDSKDSFLWFGLYSKFVKLKLEEDKFNEFMLKINDGIIRDERGNISKTEPMTGICIKEIDGMTLEGLLKNSSTKDVNIVKTKIDFLTKLMCEYFGIENSEEIYIESTNTKDYIKDFVDTGIVYNTEDTALKILMQMIPKYPYRDFSENGIYQFKQWLSQNKVSLEAMEDCVLYVDILRDYLNNSGTADNFSENDIPILIKIISDLGDDLNDEIFEEWLEYFPNTNHCEVAGDNASILEKESNMRHSYEKYIIHKTEQEN